MAARFTGTTGLAALALAWILTAQPAVAQQGAASAGEVQGQQRRGALRAEFRGHVAAADAALAAGRPAEARDRIGRAETMVANLRRPGRERVGRATQALEAARVALDRGSYQEARAALQPLLERTAPVSRKA
ncbi:hypothetical protein GWK16_16800 [Roseomonas sp. JC162]|uniref:Uncharacterized protein n=1 Tax=Neoroseomonas marina TaxID=1232220 RepID=A0A848EHN9_9PROT|nr:hypothetical protein [Neoroseomonas marina]NMJ42908.1 hypothetical protein [Neoroseomonas marina]